MVSKGTLDPHWILRQPTRNSTRIWCCLSATPSPSFDSHHQPRQAWNFLIYIASSNIDRALWHIQRPHLCRPSLPTRCRTSQQIWSLNSLKHQFFSLIIKSTKEVLKSQEHLYKFSMGRSINSWPVSENFEFYLSKSEYKLPNWAFYIGFSYMKS